MADLKARAEAAVPKFKLLKVLNQGTYSLTSTHTLSLSLSIPPPLIIRATSLLYN
jgi:hypothetical protein